MKVLGLSGDGYTRTYIVEISHNEISKVMNKSNYGDDKIPELKANTEFDIGAGYDFRNEIVRAVTSMEQAHKNFAAATTTMTKFIATLPKESDSQT